WRRAGSPHRSATAGRPPAAGSERRGGACAGLLKGAPGVSPGAIGRLPRLRRLRANEVRALQLDDLDLLDQRAVALAVGLDLLPFGVGAEAGPFAVHGRRRGPFHDVPEVARAAGVGPEVDHPHAPALEDRAGVIAEPVQDRGLLAGMRNIVAQLVD